MKLQLFYIQSSKEPWAALAETLYHKKLNGFGQFEISAIKAKSLSRSDSELKRRAESDALLSKVEPSNINVLFDERGKHFCDSRVFADHFHRQLQTGRKLNFFIGGAYGVTDEVREKFTEVLSLSNLVMNHHLAKTVALEQIYRAITIIKGVPYHND